MKPSVDQTDRATCLFFGSAVVLGAAWFYLSVMCSAQHSLKEFAPAVPQPERLHAGIVAAPNHFADVAHPLALDDKSEVR